MPRLDVTEFTEALLPLVADFDCGTLDYQQEVAEWIRGQAPGTVLDSIRKRSTPTLVWLYSTPQDGIVGFGSLCASNWDSVPDGKRDMPIVLIPNIGLKPRFQRYPPDAEREDRYSTQIMEHLKREARVFQLQHPHLLPLLGLFVHPDNEAAKRLYRRVGFVDYPQTYTDDAAGVTYQGMILALAPLVASSSAQAGPPTR